MVMYGLSSTRVMATVAVAARPRRSRPRTVIVCRRALSATDGALNVPVVSLVATAVADEPDPLFETVSEAGSRFVQTPLTSSVVALVVNAETGEVMVMAGRFFSQVMRTESVEVRPAAFLARATMTFTP